MNVGELVVKAILDNSEFKKQYNELEKQATQKKLDINVTTQNIEKLKKDLDEAIKKQQNYNSEYERLIAERSELADPFETIGGRIGKQMTPATIEQASDNIFGGEVQEQFDLLNDYDEQIEQLEKKMKEALKPSYEDITRELEKQEKELEKQQKQYDKIQQKIQQIKIKTVEQSFDKIGKSTGKTLKSIGKIGLALLGIRGIYGAIRNAISTLSNSNEDIANTLTYAKTMLATALEPIVIRIVGWIKQLMALINYISKRWFGRDLLAETDKNLKKANKSAGALKKTLAGFDEMNILNSSSTGGGGGISTDLDLDKYEEDAKKIYERTSKYLFGGENLWESFKTGFDGAWDDILGAILPFSGIWLNNVVMPMLRLTNQWVAKLLPELAPYWEEIINNNDGTLSELEILWLGFKNYLKDKILGPIKQDWENLKLWLFKLGVDIYNYFVDKINNLLSIFGVHLDRIELDTEETGKKVEENLVDPLDEMSNTEYKIDIVSNSAIKIKDALSSMWDYLTGLTKKKWNISALFSGQTSGSGAAKGGIYYPQLPRLAVGGIVNQPNRGVPYHGAVIGEHGAEGVIPLTDSQQMELLGATIGRYITIHNTNPIYMNGRLIAKEINRSNAEDDFAFNK